eukprot:6746701-Prymnesium_polylepis.1
MVPRRCCTGPRSIQLTIISCDLVCARGTRAAWLCSLRLPRLQGGHARADRRSLGVPRARAAQQLPLRRRHRRRCRCRHVVAHAAAPARPCRCR